MFRKLCGDQTLKNVAIMTNMWGNVSLETGEARERQLSGMFFNNAIDKGARFLRHVRTKESAHSVIRALLGNNSLTFQIQEELVDKHLGFSQTAAGEEIRRGLDRHAGVLEEKVKELQDELEDTEKKERETQQELEGEISRLRAMLEDTRAESIQLEARYREQRDEMQSKTDTMMRDLLSTFVGVFKLGFFSGLSLAVLLGLVPANSLVRNMVRSYIK